MITSVFADSIRNSHSHSYYLPVFLLLYLYVVCMQLPININHRVCHYMATPDLPKHLDLMKRGVHLNYMYVVCDDKLGSFVDGNDSNAIHILTIVHFKAKASE